VTHTAFGLALYQLDLVRSTLADSKIKVDGVELKNNSTTGAQHSTLCITFAVTLIFFSLIKHYKTFYANKVAIDIRKGCISMLMMKGVHLPEKMYAKL
jgi:hypothetical protein